MRKITNKNSKIRVSSVLNRDTKQFGKKYLVDEEDDTCWNSDQGSPQWIAVEFDEEELITEIRIKFQGGFAGRECWAERLDTSEKIIEFYPDDVNSLQISFLLYYKFSSDNPYVNPCTIYLMLNNFSHKRELPAPPAPLPDPPLQNFSFGMLYSALYVLNLAFS
ncbi:unnamed protein product [Mytilus edulis]|uniref:F5/8 type C domain-containing protein n=1 Tax=Mytilus edulis TaxID=6550 RepID=A0A8S3QIF2_MYTED|nr:unnamed protein product [Mytilus edulis]